MIPGKNFFYAADEGGAGGAGEQTPPAAQTEQTPPGEKIAPKTYSEDEVNGLLARKKGEEVDRLLKDLGIESTGTLKDRIAALKKYEDEHKTEVQKEKEARTAAETALTEAKARADKAEAKAEALGLGVPAAKADRFVKIAMTYDGDTVAAKIKAALDENPEFKAESPANIPNANTRIKNQGTPQADQVRAAFNTALGIKTS